MKILLTIHKRLNPNAGASGVTWQLGQEYQNLGHQVQYYSFDNLPNKLPPLAKSIFFPEFLTSHILKICRKGAVDVIDASTGDAWMWAKMFRKIREKYPLLVTRSHGLEHICHLEILEEVRRKNLHLSWKYPIYNGGFRLWEVATSLRCSDLNLVLNHHDWQYAINKLGLKPERTKVVANGIPERFINLPFEPTPKVEDTKLQIALIGTYINRKGIQYSVPALNAILNRYPNVEVSFLGTGCPEENVYADFEDRVRDRIRVIPRYKHETLPNLLKGHQIKLLPSLSEGYSLALPEAMACGLVPISTAIAGALNLVSNGHNGILITPRNSKAIEQALERLVTDRLDLERLRRNAYATSQNYSWKKIAQEQLSLYQEALAQKKYFKSK
jgi:glycosyltransferase involved in cell wall biosynthesis